MSPASVAFFDSFQLLLPRYRLLIPIQSAFGVETKVFSLYYNFNHPFISLVPSIGQRLDNATVIPVNYSSTFGEDEMMSSHHVDTVLLTGLQNVPA